MPGPDYAEVSRQLVDAGLPVDLPCAIVSGISGAEQRILATSVGALASEAKLPAPALMIVGRVATQQIREAAGAFWSGEEAGFSVPSIFVS
jgi:siroheme synthase